MKQFWATLAILLKSNKFRYTVTIFILTVIGIIIGKKLLEHRFAKPSKKDKRDFRIAGAQISFPLSFELPIPVIKNQESVGSCHDDKTEVLTRYGWKLFKDITVEDQLASVGIEDSNFIWDKPTNILKYKYNGKLICGKHLSLDFAVTPNHKMVAKKWSEQYRRLEDKFNLYDASDLGWYAGFKTDFFQRKGDSKPIIFPSEVISNGNILPEFKISMSDWVQFLGIYLAEGTVCNKEHHHRIQIAAVKDRERNYIEDLFGRMGIHASSYEDRYVIHDKRIWNKLEEYGLYRVKSYDKFVPDFVFELDYLLIRDFLKGFAMGDGYETKNGKTIYCTSSYKLAEQIEILLLMSGKRTGFYRRDRIGKESILKDGRIIRAKYCENNVAECSRKLSFDKKKNGYELDYDGFVYCAEVPTYHTLITRRNGKILLSGNCVAHSTSYLSEYHLSSVGDYEKDRVSVGWIYGYRPAGYYRGEGMYPRDAFKTVQQIGAIRHADFPYNEEVPRIINRVNSALPSLIGKAGSNKIPVYFQLKTNEEIKTCLMKYGPVSVMFPVHAEFEKPVDGKIEVSGLKNFRGYHQVSIYGWQGDYWLMVNSWGSEWGNKGTALISMKYPWVEMWGLSHDPDACIPSAQKKTLLGRMWEWLTQKSK